MIASLTSGSSGNSTLITEKNTLILLDCGASGKKISQAIEGLGFSCANISSILLTHEHIDHVLGAGILSRRFNLPIYATKETFENANLGPIREENINYITPDKSFEVGNILIHPFSISHDAKNPVGYSFDLSIGKFSSLTDTGIITEDIYSSIRDSKYMLLESNHDVEMLKFGNYPYPLKQRILSRTGHLSNTTASKVAAKMMENGVEHIMLGHLSNENNTPEIAYKTTENAIIEGGGIINRDIKLSVAKRYESTRLI